MDTTSSLELARPPLEWGLTSLPLTTLGAPGPNLVFAFTLGRPDG
jgi:hypothetical protein